MKVEIQYLRNKNQKGEKMKILIEYLDESNNEKKISVDFLRQDSNGNTFFISDLDLPFYKWHGNLYSVSQLDATVKWPKGELK